MKIIDLFFKKSPVQESRQTPVLRETSWSGDTFFGRTSKFESYDPDLLRACKGNDIYKKMLRDPQVKSAFNLVIDMLISRNFRFEKPDDSEQQKEIEDFFYYNIQQSIRSNWSQALRNILMAKAYGVSINEKNYFVDSYNGKESWMLKSIKFKQPETFNFIQDPYGNLVGLEQEVGGSHLKLNPDKFIIHVIYPEFDSVYGESDLRSAYRPYWEKDNILKFRNIYLEKFAGGFLVAKPGDNASSLSPGESAEFLNSLKRVAAGTAMTLPQGWEAIINQGVSTTAFDDAISHCDKQIAKSLMVPNLLGFSEQGSVGSFAQSKTQFESFFIVLMSQAEQLADTLNEQLFRELAWWNYGVKEFPRFTFEKHTEEQKSEIANRWINAVEKGVVINTFEDEQRTRDLLMYEYREEDQEELKNMLTEEDQTNKINEESNDIEEVTEEVKAEMAATNVPFPSQNETPPSFGPGSNSSVTGDIPSKTDSAPTEEVSRPWFDRMDFREIEQEFDIEQEKFVKEMSEDVDMMVKDLYLTVEEIYPLMVENNDKSGVDMELVTNRLDNAITKTSKSELNRTVRDNLRKSYENGRTTAQDTLDTALDGEESLMKEKIRLVVKTSKRVAMKREWCVADFVEGLRLDTAEKYFAAKSFEITGNISNEMLEKARIIILNAIRDGLSINEVITQLDEVLASTGLIPKSGTDIETDKPLTRPRLETIARTNISDAFNQASLAVYTDPDLGDFVEAFEYTSILDSRTTDFCRRYDGRIFMKNDDVWRNITPPNHFNCRSTLIPVTVMDEFRTDEKPRKSDGELVQPAPGFGKVE